MKNEMIGDVRCAFPRPALAGRGCRADEAGEAGEGRNAVPCPSPDRSLPLAIHPLPANGEREERIFANPYVLQEPAGAKERFHADQS